MDYRKIIKEIGRGKNHARDLDRDTARGLYAHMLNGEVPDLELGGVLIALRIKGEGEAEMLGFYEAMQNHTIKLTPPAGKPMPIVIPSYNGARKQANLTPLLAILLHKHHIGRIGYWAEQCAAAGFVSIHFVSVVGIPMVAPFHGRDSRFGTNPFCVVFPRKDNFPLLLDYATSAIAFGKTRVAWHKGVPVPPGCLIDVNGVPTTNPAVMQESPLGALLTFAEHKGYALAAMCEILGGALSGGKTTHQETLQTSPDAILNCMTTIIINPELFGAPDCNAQTEAFAEWVKASPHDDDKPILLPGEWEVNTRRERQKQGIPLDAGSWQAICDAARQIGMPEETLQAFCQQLAS